MVRQLPGLLGCIGALGATLAVVVHPAPATQDRFFDDFENGLSLWEVYGHDAAEVRDSGDADHGNVLVLRPNGDAHVLIRGSEAWGGVSLEGDVRFPDDENSYLGLLYNVTTRGDRLDFGNVYIKGNDSYLQVNPHRDYNVSRTLYPEFTAPLGGDDGIEIGQWTRFRIEVMGAECQVYIGDMARPKLTFGLLELDAGALGLQPRSVGSEVWVDNVQVRSIDRFTFEGVVAPTDLEYDPDELLTQWEVLGPRPETADEVTRGASTDDWQPFATDARGAVVTGRVVDYHGPRSVAYFRTRVTAEQAGPAVLHLSTIDDLALWVNGRFHWFVARGSRAWPDFWSNPDHAGQRIPIDLSAGDNEIVVRVRGGVYASGGFFARVESAGGLADHD